MNSNTGASIFSLLSIISGRSFENLNVIQSDRPVLEIDAGKKCHCGKSRE